MTADQLGERWAHAVRRAEAAEVKVRNRPTCRTAAQWLAWHRHCDRARALRAAADALLARVHAARDREVPR
jgi:hypothetical protein